MFTHRDSRSAGRPCMGGTRCAAVCACGQSASRHCDHFGRNWKRCHCNGSDSAQARLSNDIYAATYNRFRSDASGQTGRTSPVCNDGQQPGTFPRDRVGRFPMWRSHRVGRTLVAVLFGHLRTAALSSTGTGVVGRPTAWRSCVASGRSTSRQLVGRRGIRRPISC
jgi:hypothetical protein